LAETPAGDAADPAVVVPMRRQYLQIKRRFPDTLLLFRLGDFYETFDDDARVASAVLDIVLTGREMGKGQRVPMAGIPHHAAEGHIGRLIAAGYKVAVCEQIGEVAKGRGLVERQVTRVVTPGTVTDPSMLDAAHNNYIAAVVVDGVRAGVAFADVSTGEFASTELVGASPAALLAIIGRELLRLAPAEVVFPADLLPTDDPEALSWLPESASRSPTEPWRWRRDRAEERLCRHFGVESLDGFGCAGKPLAVRAAGGLLDYLADTQLNGLGQIATLTAYQVDRFMTLDAQTRRNLELTESSRGVRRHSLIAVLDQTRTPLGARLLRRWLGQPLLDLAALTDRQAAVARFHGDALVRAELRRSLGAVGDLERSVSRALMGAITPRELGGLRDSLVALPEIETIAAGMPGLSDTEGSEEAVAALHRLLMEALPDELPPVLGKGLAIRPGYASELDAHHARAREAREWIAGLERSERERTGIRSLKVGYNKVFGYYLEITTAALAVAERDLANSGRTEASALPAEYLPKQTLVNATRYFTPRLKEYETVVLTAQETLAELESEVFRRVVDQVAQAAPPLLAAAARVAYLDVVSTLAEVAIARAYVRPELDDGETIAISGGRHPVLEMVLPRGDYVANDARLETDGAQVTILTGPNMAGKSSFLRQVALITLLAQIGSFVPAERAQIGLVDRIFTRIGAQDDIATGQSTFMVEMLETAAILHQATRRSLVVLDEIGRGTSTYDGLAIARAIVEHLHNAPQLGCRTIFATHYHELTELAAILPRVRCAKMDVLEDGERIVFLRRVVPGGADRSYGIYVAAIAGVPRAIVRRSREILAELEINALAGGGVGQHESRRAAMRAPAGDEGGTVQLTFFGQTDPVVDALKQLDIEALSPLEAITTLFELQRLARGGTAADA